MNLFPNKSFQKNHNDNYLIQEKSEDYINFKSLFFGKEPNIMDKEFSKLVNPKNISISKNESNILYMNKLFQDLLSLFPKSKENRVLNTIEDSNNDIISISESNKIINDNKNFLNLKRLKKLPTGRLKQNSSIEGIHNRNAEDNMMRKIKNKAIESAYRLINDIFDKEKKNMKYSTLLDKKKNEKLKICKIAGVYSKELHLTFNLWFILQKLKGIFSSKISYYYTKINPDNNKNIINAIYNSDKDEFVNSKKILEMTFFVFYYKIFLNEDIKLLKYLDIDKNNYSFNNEDKNKKINIVDCESDVNNGDKKYRKNLEKLAKNYEKFFLEKKGRNSNKIKEDEIIKNVIDNYNYNDLKEEVYRLINNNLKNSK